jgi:hypothetical protein
MEDLSMPFLVYVKKNGRIEAQRFDEWPTRDGTPIKVLQQYQLNKLDMLCRLSFLIRKYPYRGDEDLT